MSDPYSVLGIQPDASDDEVKRAYRELARKYHPDNYQNNPLADLAEEKMKEVNEAYDAITRQRDGGGSGGYAYQSQNREKSYQSSYTGSSAAFQRARQAIARGDLGAAERILTQEAPVKNGEWYFLMGSVAYRKGWLDEARQNYQMAVQMEPGNLEYRQAYELSVRGGNAYQPYQNAVSNTDACDCCTTLMCLNCLCGGGNRC